MYFGWNSRRQRKMMLLVIAAVAIAVFLFMILFSVRTDDGPRRLPTEGSPSMILVTDTDFNDATDPSVTDVNTEPPRGRNACDVPAGSGIARGAVYRAYHRDRPRRAGDCGR